MASKRRKRKEKIWAAHEIREVVQAIDEFLEVTEDGGLELVFDVLGQQPPADVGRLPEQLRWLRAVLKHQLKPQEKR